MIEKTMFAFTFYLKDGPTVEILAEDDGLSMDQWRSDIEQCVEDEQFYTMHDMANNEWVMINARKIIIFKIKDVGPQFNQESEEGFSFK